MSERLKSELWVQAQIRLCDLNFIPAAVVRRGDPDAGQILLKLNRLEGGCEVLTPFTDLDGNAGWMRAMGTTPVAEQDADEYISRQVGRDPDIWVLEIEDRDGRYTVDGKIF